jgi:hypothetical protein
LNDFKLKLILTVLAGVVFSFIFIILAFALPTKERQAAFVPKAKGKLQIISHSFNKK